MSEIKEGSKVTCAFCKKDVEVQFMAEYDGVTAYNLTCFHRNALCESCGKMAKDLSDEIKAVKKHCIECDGAEPDE